jgi:Putative lumazine-binding
MPSDLQDIERALQLYFDGLYEGDTAKLEAVFHPESHLFGVTDGKLDDLPRGRWFAMVKERPSARSRDLPRRDWIVQIDRFGPNTAFAPQYRVRQGALPDSAALLHGLSDIR